MLSIVQQHGLYEEKSTLGLLLGLDMKRVFKAAAVLAAVILSTLAIAALKGEILLTAL